MDVLYSKVFTALEAKDFDEANTQMLIVSSLLIEDQAVSSIDVNINMLFSKGTSVYKFLNEMFKSTNRNNYTSIKECLQVVYIWLYSFPQKLSDEIVTIINMTRVILSSSKLYKYKDVSARILLSIITSEEIEMDENIILSVYGNVKSWLDDKSLKSNSMKGWYIQIIGALMAKGEMKLKSEEVSSIILNFIRGIVSSNTGGQDLLKGGYVAAQLFILQSEFTSEQLLLLYQHMKRDVCFKDEFGKRQGSREVVNFAACNAMLFAIQLENDALEWHHILQKWFRSSSRDDSKAGYEALIAINRSIGQAWAQSETCPGDFLLVLADAKQILLKEQSKVNETKLAIFTLGYLAPTAAKYLHPRDFRDLFLFLLERIEYLIFVQTDSSANVLTGNSCGYVEAISPFIESLQSDIQYHMAQFKRVTIILIKTFPKVLYTNHQIVVNTLQSMFTSIAQADDRLFQDFVKDVIKQGVIWTCSHKLAQEVEIFELDDITYKMYLPLWQGILQPTDDKEEKLGLIQRVLWDKLIKNLLYMSDKLNLRIKVNEINIENSTNQLLQAEKCNDFIVFANLSDFYCDLITSANGEYLKPWFDLLFDHLMRKSIQLPLVSGFYKLMATLLVLFEKVDYFNSDRLEQKEHVRLTYENVKNYLQHALKQVNRFKNDLQFACVLLILRMPLSIIMSIHYDYSMLYITAFKLGQHNFELANIALDTLTQWFKKMPENISHPLLRKTVPCLDAYLRNQFVAGDAIHVEGRKRKKYGQRKLNVEEEPELVQLQHKVLRFLAILPNAICLELNATSAELKLRKADTRLLKVNLPFGERHLVLWLDPFLDRVLELSVESTDRRVRITACEFLHSIVVIFLGTSAQLNTCDFDIQLEKILTSMLLLASDQDITVVDLFKPLLFQMAHWYAHPKHSISSHSRIFIKCLMDGVSNENNGAVRDLSGNVLREFLAWTRKQNSKDTLKHNLNNVKLIIDYLKQFCLHPDEAKRFGATVIFSNIYRELREEDAFVGAFWLEILYAFVMNLSLVTSTTRDETLINEINLCLDRVTRCLTQKSLIFSESRNASISFVPPKFKGNTFQDVAMFLLQHTWQINVHCRTKCMEIFKALPPDTVVSTLENYNLMLYMHDLNTTLCFEDVKTIEEILRYFASLICFIDGHIFITQLAPSFDHGDSIIWQVLNKLIDGEFKNLDLKFLQVKLGLRNDVLIRRVKDEFGYYRSKLVEKVLGLYEVLLLADSTSNDLILNDNTWDFFSDYLFDYHTLGLLDLTHSKWEETASRLWRLFLNASKFNTSVLQTLAMNCRCAMSKVEEIEQYFTPESEVNWHHRQILRGLILLQQIDKNKCLELDQLYNISPFDVLYKILGFDKMEDGEVLKVPKLKDSQREYFTLRLELMLDEESNPNYTRDLSVIVSALCVERLIYSTESKTTLPQGVFLFLLFKKTILRNTLKENRLFSTLALIANESSIDLRVKYYKEYLKHINNTPQLKSNCQIQDELVKSVEHIWPAPGIKAEDGECINDDVCLELVYDLRLIVDRLPSVTMLNTIVHILNKPQLSEVQQVYHLTRVSRILGMVAPRGWSKDIGQLLKGMKHQNREYFSAPSKRVTTTLFIKTLFDSTNYSFCLNFFTCALDFYISVGNDFEVDADFCAGFMAKVPYDLQIVLLDVVYAMGDEYTFNQNVVLTLCVCNLLAYCDYQVFEEFYIKHIKYIIDGFSTRQLMDKVMSCIMLNRLFGNIKIENLQDLSCKITKAYFNTVNTGTELSKLAASLLFNACKETLNDSYDPEEFRLYQCYAYNAATTLVCNTRKDKQEVYRMLFYRVDEFKEDILWTKLVPSNMSFNFGIISEEIPKKKKVLLDIRTHLPDDHKEKAYIQSQNLFLSTLAEDITHYDFTNVCVRHEEAANSNQDKMSAMSVEMDDEDINKHVCMLPILGVIRHMHENNLLPAEPPRWVHDVASMLIKNRTPMNIRQFLCKVIENAQVYLKCYADILIPGIIKTICGTTTTINALASDCVVMLITTWKDHSPSIDDTTDLIKFLMTNLWHERTDVFKYNVNLLKITVETYRQFILDPGFVDSLFPNNPADKSALFVIHIVNILLVNNISPFPLRLKKFCTRMSKILMGPHHQIYLATAETLGLALKFLDDTNHSSLTPLKELIVANLETLFRDRTQVSKPVDVLEAIAKNYPDICSPLLPTIQRKMEIKESLESSKTAYLRIYLRCINKICDSGYIYKLPLCNWLSSSALDTVIVTLEIILASVEFITVANAKHLVEGVVNLPNSNPICRTIRIDILIAFYMRFYQCHDEQSSGIIQMVKDPLISGFLDTELDIRTKVFDFWIGEQMLPPNLEEKFLFLLDNLYDSNNEESFLSFCNCLILHDIRDSGEPIFTIPLYQCNFKDYEVNSYWRSKNTAMIPMFTASEQTQQCYLKATQSYEFEQTQLLATQRKSFIQSASVMSFGLMPQSTRKDSVFKNPNDMDISTYKVKKWRFFKDKANVSKMHAIREIYKGKTIEKKKQDAKKMKEEEVKIYRKYRKGDYPDIQIGVKAVTDTLKELSKCDAHIAQLLYKSLFDAIVVIAVNDDLIYHVCNAIKKVFTSSVMFDPMCMGVFLQIALEHRQSMRFPADLIKTVATKSGNLSYGCLLLEEYLTHSEAEDPSWDTLHWIRLADLYKKMEEWDAVQGIYASKISCSDELVLAVKAESENNWDVARKYYMELSIKDNDFNRKDFYYEALFKCSEELCDWKEIEKRCLETTRSNSATVFDALWSSEWNKEVILPQYIRSQMRVIDKRSDFDAKIKEAMKDNKKKEFLRNEFSDELALMYLDKMKIKLAGNYAENYAKRFLKLWKFVKPSYGTMGNKMLLTMKNCAEILVLLDMYDKLNKDTFNDIVGDITQMWEQSNSIDDAISTHHLTTRITMREFFLHLTELKLRSLLKVREHTLVSCRLSNISFEAEVNIIKRALQHNNYPLAKHFLSRNYDRSENNYRHPITCLLYGKVVLIKVLKGNVAAIAKTKHYVEAFKAHQKCVTQFNIKETPSLAIDSALYLSELCKIVGSTPVEDEMDLRLFQPFVQDYDLNRFSDLLSYGFENLRDTLHQLDVLGNVDQVQLADAFLNLASEYASRGEGYENRYLECALKSMQYGSEKARLGFPKLLGVSGLMAIYKTQFIEQTSNIPTYMFISWIPQLLAYCDTGKVSLVKHIVIKLAKEYPNSIIYAYKLSRKKFTYVFEETLVLTQALDVILHNELVDKILAALKYVAVPATIIRTAILKLRKCSTEDTFKQVAYKIQTLFRPEEDSMIRGEQYEHVLKYQTKLTELINTPFDKETIKKALSEIQIPSIKHSTDLGRYSPWLNYFHASDYDQEIEVPGCYTGNCRPLPHYHPKISKFSSDVTVLQSLFKPIRITIYANDVREYRFLIKYGEDLRQDQRIEQLFKLMNVALSSDVKCRERKLQVSTFEVIPLTDELGFIQWVDETEILKKMITKRSGYPALEEKMKKCLINMSSRASTIRTREQVCFDYKQLVDFLPRDALRRSLWNISPDPETFFALRLSFIRSYAVMCITNWLLGIGDRHLDNILLNMNTGNVIGIDFGHAFGSATQQQGVAELVPFRLTPQILNIMTPLKESGPLQHAMVNTLRVLRENCDTLLSTMDVFIMEPTLNWLHFPDDTWNSTIIMELSRAKFHGTNPINIMLREVEARRQKEPPKELYIDCLATLLNSLKLDEEDGISSVHSQVECLIAMATDANLLGRMYHGWESWL